MGFLPVILMLSEVDLFEMSHSEKKQHKVGTGFSGEFSLSLSQL